MIMNSKSLFNLTTCKKLQIRRKTLFGKTLFYHTYFQPKGLDKFSRRFAIDHFKHPSTENDKMISYKMINYSVDEFLKVHDIKEFDTILGMPSSSGIVKKIINEFIHRGFSGEVIYKGFIKNRMRNIFLRTDLLNSENSIKTKRAVPASFNKSRINHYDKVAKSSLFPTRFRRYLGGLMRINFNRGLNREGGIQCCSTILGKKILIVDDTFGEGFSLREATELLAPYTKNVIGFTVMKDMSL